MASDDLRTEAPLRILLASETLLYGVGLHIVLLARSLRDAGVAVTVAVSAARADSAVIAALRNVGVALVDLPIPTNLGAMDVLAVARYRSVIANHGPFDLVHAHSAKAGGVARFARFLGIGPPVVYSPHAFKTMDPKISTLRRWSLALIERMLGWKASARIVVTSTAEAAYAETLGLPPARLRLVRNAVVRGVFRQRAAVRAESGFDDDDVVLGWASRWTAQKAPERFLGILANAHAANPRIKGLIVTLEPLPDNPTIDTLVAKGALRIAHGRAADYLSGADIHLLTSRYEGMPHILLEAANAGLAQISTNVGGATDVIQEGLTGYIIPGTGDGDDNAIITAGTALAVGLAADPTTLVNMQMAAPQSVDTMTVGAMANEIVAVYREIARPLPIRVMHVTEAPLAGVASVLEEIVPWQHSSPRVGRVVILAPSAILAGITASDFALGFDFEVRSMRGVFRFAKTIAAAVEAEKPDIVHFHSTFAGLAGRMALGWRRRRPRIVYCAHGWSFVRHASRSSDFIARQTERWLSILTDCIVCVSHGDLNAALAIGIAPKRCRVVLNGIAEAPLVEALAKPDWPKTDLRLLFIGRFDRQKGHDILVEAMRRVRTPMKILSIGASSESVSAMNFPPNMQVLGWTPRAAVQSLLAGADAVVMPSRWEGLPMVAIEAMRAGVAVIAAAVPGLIEVVEDGVTGRLFPPEDPAALARVLDSLESTACAAMGTQGRAHFLKNYTHERMNTELVAVYEDLLQNENRVSVHTKPSAIPVLAEPQPIRHEACLEFSGSRSGLIPQNWHGLARVRQTIEPAWQHQE